MAPKKQQKQKQASKGKPLPSASASGGPKLQLSAENESRLRRLLLNSSARPTAAPSPADDSLSVAQKAKRLRAVYEKLSCEGFSNDQIEMALSALKDSATFEAALDWLCLNLPGNELPSKFSSGTSNADTGGSINVLVSARDDWTPSENSSLKVDEEPEISVRAKWQGKDDALDSDKQTQADWIRQYMEQQEEDEPETWEDIDEDSQEKVHEPRSYDVIAKEYHDARYEAAKAKQRKDKKAQEQAGLTIRKLKQELSVLGLSEDMLALEFGQKYDLRNGSEDIPSGVGAISLGIEGCNSSYPDVNDSMDDDTNVDSRSPQDIKQQSGSRTEPAREEDAIENNLEEVELGGLFTEDTAQANPSEVLKKEKRKWSDKDLEGFWKKGDPAKIPKAVLHQFCQKSGWEAPKFEKGAGKGRQFSYMVSVVRKASGRGKSRKPGGLITLKLPDNEENAGSAEDAQNKVAAFALCQLFPDLPVHLVITEPYASLARQWMEDEQSTNVEETQEDRRADFVSSLLKSTTEDASERMDAEKLPKQSIEEHIVSTDTIEPATERFGCSKEAESSHLRQDQEKRKNLQKYKGMLKARAALPIAELKDDILRALKERDVLVVCGETGSGKTTQVPQFILDDMIESGQGGYCNIICTQPRRIAAISVAERVAEERCESSPGSKGSLVGYQVRLDSARTDKTKLLFCTTGILLRKIAGDNNLTGVTHVIVDEVHERSLLGDFLIILKSLLERQSAAGGPQKLKIILMSATVDSNLFSRYFGNCPVITAQGRTHPVDTKLS